MCVLLGLQYQLRRKQCLRLRLSSLGSVDDVGDELRTEGQWNIAAIDIADLLLIDDEEMIASRASGDVRVFAQLDIAFGAEDEEPAVAPGSEAVGCEPVNTHVTDAAIAAKHHVTEVLEFRMLRMVDIADLRGDGLGRSGARVEEKLIDLVRTDVGENAAVLCGFPEPVWPRRGTAVVSMPLLDLVRCDVQRLHDSSDGSGLNEFTGLDRGADFEALAVHDAVGKCSTSLSTVPAKPTLIRDANNIEVL